MVINQFNWNQSQSLKLFGLNQKENISHEINI